MIDSTDPQFVATCAREGIGVEEAAAAVANGTMVFLRSYDSRSQDGYSPILVGAGTRRKVTALIGLGPRDTDRAAIVDSMAVINAAGPDAVIDLTTNPEGIALRRELKDVVGVPLGCCLTYDLFAQPRTKGTDAGFGDRFGHAA
ncbi:phosphomethylpyrimidine synthase ThiC [Nocardia farcinica]|uniref:phosphomethylpyrimidine synthase ThiC n=1 Tax=Nocardia farcinica TaxID=37329 RepID=UPI001893A9A0|nr:phosphomethylpyrimidine synthase ThiC [Nocardia farcinica]MBF6234592.1 phosphomethylpyrimidine synthase ThiC [Nocardia farcinica]